MEDKEAAAARLEALKALGVRIAIDDFGSGYAYRADLQKMPIDFLKVDRGSLDAGEDEDYRSWLLEAILVFGRDLSLTVIAKGVESQDQVDALQSMGCTMAQGFFLGEPVAADGRRRPVRRAGGRRGAGRSPRWATRPSPSRSSGPHRAQQQPREPDLVQDVVALALEPVRVEQRADPREHPLAVGVRQRRDPAEARHQRDQPRRGRARGAR